MAAVVKCFHETDSHTAQYVVHCPNTKKCALIDTVLVYNPVTGILSSDHLADMVAYINENGLTVEWILESHAHADHVSGAPFFKEKFGGKVGIGSHITAVQSIMASAFNIPVQADGSQFDQLFSEGDKIAIGDLSMVVMHTPGHTPACVSYYIENDCVFVGDTIFMPDQGTARCDFPGGSSETLWDSVQRILSLPENVRLFTCHDYAPGGRDYAFETTVGEEKKSNKHVKEGTSADEFKQWRAERDATLNLPRLILPSIQLNIAAGQLPPAEDNGVQYVKIPLNRTNPFA